jgi:D-cysteine desulfhydrase
MPALSTGTGAASVRIKHDDCSGPVYGGNKVRKLEFLLGEALARDCKEVLTFGVAGSNHVLATGLYARELGLTPIACVTPQTNSRYVARNLRAGARAGVEYLAFGSQRDADVGARRRCLRGLLRHRSEPYTIRLGGSSALGTVGFVNAAFELSLQLEASGQPIPDRIYLPLGTMGTAVGLALGLRALGHTTRIIAVRVVDPRIGNADAAAQLFAATAALLQRCDRGFPDLDPAASGLEIRHEFFGERYAVFTAAGMAAIDRFARLENVILDGTYTGKAAAGMLADLADDSVRDKHVLFWNTYNSQPLDSGDEGFDYRALPQPLWRYFETPPQPLDR